MSEMDADERETGELVRAAQRGDTLAQDSLLRQHLDGLRAFVRLRSRSAGGLRMRESESDLVQSICREVLSDLSRFEYRDAAGFRGWLYTLALNKVREKARYHAAERRTTRREQRPVEGRESRELPAYGAWFTPSEHAMGNEARERFEAAFDRLAEDHREVILLSRLVRLPHREVAERLGKSEVAVRSLLSRALVALSLELERKPHHP
jgi:RNA polymerase sigma-70 factor (ECF subfamily)